jgi:hypothetical protein
VDGCDLQKRESRSADILLATLIRHAPLDEPPPVLALAVAMIEASFGAALVPPVRGATLLTSRLLPAPLRAVPLAAIAAAAHAKRQAAGLTSTESQP